MKKIYYIIVALGVLFAIRAVFIFTNHKNFETVAVKEQVESTTARIDIGTKLVNADKTPFEVYVDGSDIPEKQNATMNKFDNQGYIIKKEGNSIDLTVRVLDASDLKLILRGSWEKDEVGNLVENWVTFTSIKINGEEILSTPQSVWHNKPFNYVINAKAGETYTISAKWQKK